jgi:transposase
MLHRARDLLMRQRTQVINAMRAHLAELGIEPPINAENCTLSPSATAGP